MADSEVRTVVLANGATISGRLLLVAGARYLVQTDALCLSLAEDEIRSVDGQIQFREAAVELPTEVNEASYLHDVHPDGGGTDCEWSREVHHGPDPKASLTFVLGRTDRPLTVEDRHELGLVVHSTKYRDRWGRELPTTIKETDTGWQFEVQFSAPVMPGESYEIVRQATWRRWSRQEGDEWVRSHFLRPSAGVLVAIVVQLPEGAAYTSIEPTPLWRLTVNQREQVGWRRYIEPGVAFTPSVRYRLG
jgi:hypothetical protein